MEFTFSVGTADSHEVKFKYSRLTNTVQIDVDGNQVKKDKFWIWIPAHRRYDFKVGGSERHDVDIELNIPRAWSKFRNPSCNVIVDGQLVRKY